ncbi:BlaI/MecI/CopY family transcriptional regulator [Streptomyces sp. NPDC014734]|uniref:BlaI/MecI/CopY family transcriptional regulator n=1 Tax=Streptomyces sp. NPDC014734 TaxID=3364886 RepID=UPI00370303CA
MADHGDGGEWGTRARRRGQGELEAQVLSALRAAPGPQTAAWVREHLGGTLAYTTVMTILTRLHAKSAVTRERSGRAFLWTAAADEAGLAAHRMRRVLDNETDREAVLMSFVSGLSARDEELLRSLLNDVGGDGVGTSDGDGSGGGTGGGGTGRGYGFGNRGGRPDDHAEDRDGREN